MYLPIFAMFDSDGEQTTSPSDVTGVTILLPEGVFVYADCHRSQIIKQVLH